WHLMPTDTDTQTLETISEVLGPLGALTDALSAENSVTISSVQPILWQVKKDMAEAETDRPLAKAMKEVIRESLENRYSDGTIQQILNCSSFLDPRFKDEFVTD